MASALLREPEQTTVSVQEERIGDYVLDRLGRPNNLYRVDVKKLWGDKFRVNVLCTVEKGLRLDIVRITDSFFATVSDLGIETVPAIAKKYH